MKTSTRRSVLGACILLAAAGGAYAYWLSLVPATHPDHDHGILNLDAGGRILVTTRDGKSRNLVGRPGKPLVLHFTSPEAPGAVEELAKLFDAERKLRSLGDAEILVVTKAKDFHAVDAWLAAQKLEPPRPNEIVLDPSGDTTTKLNCKRPIETMVFTAEGKLSAQSRGPLEWGTDLPGLLEKARGGVTLE